MADFTPVGGWSETPFAVLVRKDFPAADLRGLFALLRREPGRHRYGSGGPASAQTLATIKLLRGGRVDVGAQHFSGSGPARTALAAGQVSFMLDMVPTALEAASGGRFRILAVTTAARLPAVPEIPTAAESSGVAELTAFDVGVFGVVLAPPETPADIVAPLHAAIRQAQAVPAVRERLAELGSLPLPIARPAEVRVFLARNRARLEAIAKSLENG